MTKSKLSFEQACAQYVHRFTMDHIPAWSQKQRDDGTYYAPHFKNDREWYDNTIFPPHNGLRKYCTTSNQSWPLGTSLNAPFKRK